MIPTEWQAGWMFEALGPSRKQERDTIELGERVAIELTFARTRGW